MKPISPRLVTALLLVYVFWGSTYLAIAMAIETIPPFFMASMRFLIAGSLLYGYMRLIKKEPVLPGNWKSAWIMGALLLLFGNGGVVYAQQFVPSGIAALMVGSGPFWFMLLGWLWLKDARPGPMALAGLLIGFTGLAILIGVDDLGGSVGLVPLPAAIMLLIATITWSVGSIYAKTLDHATSPMMLSAMQMLTGSVLMFFAGILHGELPQFSLEAIHWSSVAALLYLVVFGSLVGYSAYLYVLRHASPALASTYAYVNPVVAVFIGWALADEPVNQRTIVAASMIVGAVILLSWPRRKQVPAAKASEPSTEVAQLTPRE